MEMSIWNLAGWLYQEATGSKESGRRRNPRRKITEAVIVRCPADDMELVGRMHDVAPDALGVSLPAAIPAHSHVLVRTTTRQGAWCPAYVIHSTSTLGGFKIGLRML